MQIDEKIALSKKLHAEYLYLRSNGNLRESIEKEKEYLKIRSEVINSVNEDIGTRKSITLDVLHNRVKSKPKLIKYETGIIPLDYELVSEKEKLRHIKGGFSLGNFIQFAGAKGAGKSSIIVKILCGFSLHQKTSWFNFEMSEDKVDDMVENFTHTKTNLFYYDGSMDIKDICDEIKYLYRDGVRHFLIDSMMKINAKGYKRGYESFSYISSTLSELTSQLGINVYLINQVSQDTEKGGGLYMKHGNDAEYDSDYIFFLVKPFKTDINKKIITIDGQPVYDEDRRVLHCTKNRDTHRLFKVDIKKSDIFGISPDVIEYEMEEL
jgi:KaiC/GvpD/RAD55 family RecA-like ATPase